MSMQRHPLTDLFPNKENVIHELKMSDAHFARLYEQFDEVEKELHRIDEQIETPSDEYIENVKKKRLQLEDELGEMIRNYEAAA